MDETFAKLVNDLAPKLQTLRAMTPASNGKLPVNMPQRGVYLFSEAGKHLYIGRSNNLRRRYGLHCRPGAMHNQASFAFHLARQATNNLQATYRSEGSRAWLVEQPTFLEAFTAAKVRIRAMDYR